MITARQQRVLEYVMEHEGLTANVTDAQAAPLLQWAIAQASQFAADSQYTDTEVDAVVTAIRRVMHQVTIGATSEVTSDHLVALAEKLLTSWISEQQLSLLMIDQTFPIESVASPLCVSPENPPPSLLQSWRRIRSGWVSFWYSRRQKGR